MAMVKKRATHKEIGYAIGVTRQYVRQLIMLIAQEHGDTVFEADEVLWTSQEAAEELAVSTSLVRVVCREGEVPHFRRGGQDEILISQEGMNTLKVHPRVTREWTCLVCGRLFNRHQTSAQMCSDQCARERRIQTRLASMFFKPPPDSLRSWHKNLWQKLRYHRLARDEKWLTIKEAQDLTSLSKMQLRWLGHRRIITTRSHPAKRWNGRPVTTYAASQVKIAWQVFKRYKQSNGKHH